MSKRTVVVNDKMQRGYHYEFTSRLAGFLAVPGTEFDFYGITPRNAVTLLIFGVVVLRWRHNFPAAYWLIFLSSLAHATYGVLVLFMFCSIDCLIRPGELRRVQNIVPALATLTSFVARSRTRCPASG